MLGIRCPDRHALLRITLPKTHRPRPALPSRASGFVHRVDSGLRMSVGSDTEANGTVELTGASDMANAADAVRPANFPYSASVLPRLALGA
jgi:hypothetical protein